MNIIADRIVSEAIFNTHKRDGSLRYDFTNVVNDGAFISALVDLFNDQLIKFDIDTVIGSGYGGAQLCSAIAAKHPRYRSVIVRTTPHVKQNNRQIEGDLSSSKRIAIIDDAIFSGNSIRELLELLPLKQRAKIVCAVVMYDNWEPLGTRQLEQQHFPVKSIVDRRDIGLTRDATPKEPKLTYSKFFLSPDRLVWADYDGGNKAAEWAMKSSPVFHGNLLINVTDQYVITGYDKLTGAKRWVNRMPGSYKADAYTKGVVQKLQVSADGFMYVSGYDGSVTKLNPINGEAAWRVRVDICCHSTPILLNSDSLIINTESYQQSAKRGGGFIKCLNPATGDVRWSYQHNDFPPSSITPISDVAFLATANDGSVLRFDDDQLSWSTVTKAEVKAPALVIGKHAFLVDVAGNLYKLNISTGKLLWSRRACSNGWLVTPIVHEGLIVVWDSLICGARSSMMGYDQSGRRRWISWLRSGIASVIPITDDELLVCSSGTQVAYYKGLNKEWEANYGVPGAKLHSDVAVDHSAKLITLNFTGQAGLQTYTL